MNEAGSKIEAHAFITVETSFLRSQGDFQKDCFLKDGFAKYDVSGYLVLGDLWCCSVKYFLACYEEKIKNQLTR